MKKLKLLALPICMLFIASAYAKDSFRMANGRLISTGQQKPEVIALAGLPISTEVETIAVDEGSGEEPVKREVLTYKLNSTVGGEYLVVVRIENNIVVSVSSTQMSRL